MKNLLNIENITKEYNVAGKTVVALNNLSLEVNHGDCLAIVGESGSGKTTMAEVLVKRKLLNGSVLFINAGRLRNEDTHVHPGYPCPACRPVYPRCAGWDPKTQRLVYCHR